MMQYVIVVKGGRGRKRGRRKKYKRGEEGRPAGVLVAARVVPLYVMSFYAPYSTTISNTRYSQYDWVPLIFHQVMAPLKLVPTTTSLISRCNAPPTTSAVNDITSAFSLKDLIAVHTHANMMVNCIYDVVTQTLQTRTMTAIQQLPTILHSLQSTELAHLKAFCDAAYKSGNPQTSNQLYDALLREINKRSASTSLYITTAKTNPFLCAHWSDASLLDVISSLDTAFAQGTPMIENKCYDIICKELSFRSDDVIKSPSLPAHWSYPISAIDQIELMPDSQEFVTVKQLLTSSLPAAVIHSIKRIQNYGLYRMFQFTRFVMASKSGRILPEQVTTRLLFHGCGNLPGVEEIIQFGFYRQYCPGGAIGDGCYYALNASYSNNPPYVLRHADGSKQLFLAQVLVGSAVNGYFGLKALPLNSQSVHDGPVNMYCIFDHLQAYPEYVIHYSC